MIEGSDVAQRSAAAEKAAAAAMALTKAQE
jgi:hypothetical protein